MTGSTAAASLEGVHHVLAKVWVIAGELGNVIERRGQVP